MKHPGFLSYKLKVLNVKLTQHAAGETSVTFRRDKKKRNQHWCQRNSADIFAVRFLVSYFTVFKDEDRSSYCIKVLAYRNLNISCHNCY